MNWKLRHHICVLIGLTVAAAGTRFYRLGDPGLWGDELATIHGALNNQEFLSKRLGYLPTRLGLISTGLGPEHLSVDAVTEWRSKGLDEFAARWPTAVIGIVTVPLIYLAACMIVSPGTAALAALFLAFSHWHLLWSQSARFYAPQFLFYTAALMVFFRATQGGRMQHWIGAALLAGLACLSQPTAAVIFGVFGLYLLAQRWTGEKRLLAGKTLVVVIILVGIVIVIIGRDVWLKPDRWAQFLRAKPNHPPFRLMLSSSFYVQLSMMGAGLATAVSLWWRKRSGLALFLLLAGILPPLAYSIVGLRAFVEVRYALGCLFPWLLLAAIGCAEIASMIKSTQGRWLSVVPALALLGSQGTLLFGYYTEGGYRSRIREAYAYVREHIDKDDQLAAEMLEGPFYVGRAIDYDVWREWKQVQHASANVWVVCGAKNQGGPWKWLRENGDLRAAFSTYVAGPGETVFVYLVNADQQ